jgi:hypothetical protein
MIVWGGSTPAPGGGGVAPLFDDGAVYHLCDNSWTAMSTAGAPSHVTSQVTYAPVHYWTGKRLIVWGGLPTSVFYGEGMSVATASMFDPTANAWLPMNRSGEPLAREVPAQLWTGSRLLVWGGIAQTSDGTWVNHNDGALFDPVANRWTAMTSAGAPAARDPLDQVVWTGSRFVVWGGVQYGGAPNAPTGPGLPNGGIYDPASDSWTTIATAGAPAGYIASLAWTGKKVLVLAKIDGSSTPGQVIIDGAALDPATNTWSAMASPGAALAQNILDPIAERASYPISWAGGRLVVIAVRPATATTASSAFVLLYDPDANSWTTASFPSMPDNGRWQQVEVVGDRILFVGPGLNVNGHASTVMTFFAPATGTWTPLPQIDNRSRPAVVESASHVLAWGGADIFPDLDAGNPCPVPTDGPCDPGQPTTSKRLSDGLALGF